MERFIELCRGEIPHAEVSGCVALSFAQREKARQRVALQSGEEIIINIRRGQVMRGGDCVKSHEGRCVMVEAAIETVSTVHCDDPLQLTRIAYHLGNRHVWLQVGDGWLRYLHDHVLDDMVRGLGGSVAVEEAPFEPEAGAYGGHGHHQH
jgi:urease accessory protein